MLLEDLFVSSHIAAAFFFAAAFCRSLQLCGDSVVCSSIGTGTGSVLIMLPPSRRTNVVVSPAGIEPAHPLPGEPLGTVSRSSATQVEVGLAGHPPSGGGSTDLLGDPELRAQLALHAGERVICDREVVGDRKSVV